MLALMVADSCFCRSCLPSDFWAVWRSGKACSTGTCTKGRKTKAKTAAKARVAADRGTLKKAAAAGEPVSSLYFLFEHGNVLDEETVRYASSVDVRVVASVNNLHYIIRRDHSTAESDIRKLREWGVAYYQIDSDFESFFTKKK